VAAVKASVHLAAGVVDILDFGQVVSFAGGEVIHTREQGRVHCAGALVGGDVGCGDAENGAMEEGVGEGCASTRTGKRARMSDWEPGSSGCAADIRRQWTMTSERSACATM